MRSLFPFALTEHKISSDVGNKIAHAYQAPTGEVHLDASEHWTDSSFEGMNLEAIATHEIGTKSQKVVLTSTSKILQLWSSWPFLETFDIVGHVLGLHHSKVKDSIMQPSFQGYKKNLKLSSNDVWNVQKLYGKLVAARVHQWLSDVKVIS